MTLLEIMKQLCEEHGETFASLERKLKFGNGTIRKWGAAIPSGDKLAKVADFFNVSTDYLLGRQSSSDSTTSESSLNYVYFSFAKDAQDNGIDPRDIETVLEILKRNRERG